MQQNQTTQSNPGQVLGIVGLVLGILAAIVSFIPCLGIYAIFPGIAGIVLSAISMSQSVKVNAPKGLAIAGLVCAIVGTCIAGYQWYIWGSAAKEITKNIDDLEKAGKDFEKAEKDLEKLDRELDKLDDNYNGSGYSSPDAGDYNQAVEDASNQYNDAYDDAQQQYNDAIQDAQNQIDNMDLNP
jgi:tetratricopeptide (TPR) repeat protein